MNNKWSFSTVITDRQSFCSILLRLVVMKFFDFFLRLRTFFWPILALFGNFEAKRAQNDSNGKSFLIMCLRFKFGIPFHLRIFNFPQKYQNHCILLCIHIVPRGYMSLPPPRPPAKKYL